MRRACVSGRTACCVRALRPCPSLRSTIGRIQRRGAGPVGRSVAAGVCDDVLRLLVIDGVQYPLHRLHDLHRLMEGSLWRSIGKFPGATGLNVNEHRALRLQKHGDAVQRHDFRFDEASGWLAETQIITGLGA